MPKDKKSKKLTKPRVTVEQLQETLDLKQIYSFNEITKMLNIGRGTVEYRINKAKQLNMIPSSSAKKEAWEEERHGLKDEIRKLNLSLKAKRVENINAEFVRKKILELKNLRPDPPTWPTKKAPSDIVGIPLLQLSDLHWGEVVHPEQVNNVNTYNIEIAQRRLKRVISKTIDLCMNHQIRKEYQGIVLALLGDLINGTIHDNDKTNEMPIMATFLDLYGCLIWAIEKLANAFGKVFIPCVPGNHSRTTIRPVFKDRNHTNYEWLLASLLEKYFENDNRVQFSVSEGADAYFTIYNTKFFATHGDAMGVRGGDGIIGPIGPIKRGDVKMRALSDQINMPYDVSLIGHFHQSHNFGDILTNGSLIGYNEFAKLHMRAKYEPPTQNLIFTHSIYGVTQFWKIHAERPKELGPVEWISWPKEGDTKK